MLEPIDQNANIISVIIIGQAHSGSHVNQRGQRAYIRQRPYQVHQEPRPMAQGNIRAGQQIQRVCGRPNSAEKFRASIAGCILAQHFMSRSSKKERGSLVDSQNLR